MTLVVEDRAALGGPVAGIFTADDEPDIDVALQKEPLAVRVLQHVIVDEGRLWVAAIADCAVGEGLNGSRVGNDSRGAEGVVDVWVVSGEGPEVAGVGAERTLEPGDFWEVEVGDRAETGSAVGVVEAHFDDVRG